MRKAWKKDYGRRTVDQGRVEELIAKRRSREAKEDEEEYRYDEDYYEEDYDLIDSLELSDSGQIARSGGELTQAAAMLSR